MSGKRYCGKPGCLGVMVDGRCTQCGRRTGEPKPQQPRASAAERGYGHRWRKARAAYLAQHPLCVECERLGRTTPATVVDHIVPHRGNQRLFWRRSNWQALCKAHHDAKTGKGE